MLEGGWHSNNSCRRCGRTGIVIVTVIAIGGGGGFGMGATYPLPCLFLCKGGRGSTTTCPVVMGYKAMVLYLCRAETQR